MTEVLHGLRVVDFTTGRAGGLATTVLADFGAEVIKVEPPGGDRFRAMPSSPMWLRGKKSVVIDLTEPQGRAKAVKLIAAADVVVVSGQPKRIRAWGLDGEAVLDAHPSVVHCTITGWGTEGPYADLPGYEALVAAKSGRMASFDVQLQQGRPVYSAVQVATHVVAQTAVHGIMSALYRRELDGSGHRVETSLFQALIPFDIIDTMNFQRAHAQGEEFISIRARHAMPTLNYHPVRAADGTWIQCGNLLEHLFLSFLDAIDLLGELLSDERFQGPPATWGPEAIEVARDQILLRVQEKSAAEWMAIFADNGNVAAEPIVDAAHGLEHADMVEGGCLVELTDPIVGPVTQVGPIAELTKTPAVLRSGAPIVDEHAAQISAAEFAAGAIAPPATAEPAGIEPMPAGRPLDGVTILDLSTIIAGPLGVSMLADLGARVIKVEPFGGDPFRHLVPDGCMAVKTNAGKESICIDLKTPEGQAIMHELVADADVLVHNFRGAVPEKLGIGYEQLAAIRPDLIWTVINGYGPHGPGAPRPATHPVMGAAAGGVAYQAGKALTDPCESLAELREAARQIMAANDANPDPNTSVVAASAILLALYARQRTGIGQMVRVNMQVANAWANSDAFLAYEGKPDRTPVDVELFGLGALYRLYSTADGWVFLAASSDTEFARFCAAVDRLELSSDQRFASPDQRRRHDGELAAEIGTIMASGPAATWEANLVAAGVGCVRADDAETAAVYTSDPHVLANGWAPAITHPRFGSLNRWGPAVTVGGLNPDYRTAPLAGEHTDALLLAMGKTAAQIATLRATRIVNSETP